MHYFLKTTLVEDIIIVISFIFGISLIIYLIFLNVFARVIEPVYVMIFNKPVYVHLYLNKKPVTDVQRAALLLYSPFYKSLSEKRKKYFEHRLNQFLAKYRFHGRQDFAVTDDMKTRIAAVYVMLTFGMRNYLTRQFSKIILYPSAFYSETAGEYHKGEFNPAMKAVVFSWEDFEHGCNDHSDNLHLGLHEFAHVLYLHCRKDRDVSSAIFIDECDAIRRELKQPMVLERMKNAGYLREYAFTNGHELLAVMLEHFFETPRDFRSIFPDLYKRIATMINYDPLSR